MKVLGMVVIRLSPLGIKWETQIADALANPSTREVTLYNDQSRKYCVTGAGEMAQQMKESSQIEKRTDEKHGWKFGEWKKVGTDKILGLKANVYERKRTIPGIRAIVDKLWILDDPRLAQFKQSAGDTSAVASRTKLPESGLPLKRTSTTINLRAPAGAHVTNSQPATPENPLELLGPAPDEKGTPSKSNRQAEAAKPSSKAASKPSICNPEVDFLMVSVTREKTDPERYKLPKNYTRVKNYSDVLEMGGLDGTLNF
jgi:hypothetical protein